MIFAVLRVRYINLVLRALLRQLLPVLPSYFPGKFPVVGDIQVGLPDSKTLVFSSNGRDSIASKLHWEGLGGHEPETVRLFLSLLPHSKTVFDVGASTGLYALLAAIECKNRKVHAFEPVPETFDFLVNNSAKNAVDNLTAVRSCVTNYDGEALLHLNHSPALPYSASIEKGNRPISGTIVSQAVTIDSYVASSEIRKIDLLKIDAEGTDQRVLEGAEGVLKRDEPLIICEVLYNDTDKQLDEFFADTDYQFFWITDDGLIHKNKIVGDSNYKYRNYLFITKSKIPEVLRNMTLVGYATDHVEI